MIVCFWLACAPATPPHTPLVDTGEVLPSPTPEPEPEPAPEPTPEPTPTPEAAPEGVSP